MRLSILKRAGPSINGDCVLSSANSELDCFISQTYDLIWTIVGWLQGSLLWAASNKNKAMQRSFGMNDLGVPVSAWEQGATGPCHLSWVRHLLTSGFNFIWRNSPGTVHHYCRRFLEIFFWGSVDSQHHLREFVDPIWPVKSVSSEVSPLIHWPMGGRLLCGSLRFRKGHTCHSIALRWIENPDQMRCHLRYQNRRPSFGLEGNTKSSKHLDGQLVVLCQKHCSVGS